MKRFKIEKIRSRKVCVEVLRNLFFVKELYKGAVVPQSSSCSPVKQLFPSQSDEVGVSKVIGYVWLEKWNKEVF